MVATIAAHKASRRLSNQLCLKFLIIVSQPGVVIVLSVVLLVSQRGRNVTSFRRLHQRRITTSPLTPVVVLEDGVPEDVPISIEAVKAIFILL